MNGGSLLEYIKKHIKISEYRAAKILKSILKAMAYCHSRNIIHRYLAINIMFSRDLKPDNIMFDSLDDECSLKIIDFGFSALPTAMNLNRNYRAGSIYYMPPESREHKYNEKADMWAIGVIMFRLLGGYYPFATMDSIDFYKYIEKGNLQLIGINFIHEYITC